MDKAIQPTPDSKKTSMKRKGGWDNTFNGTTQEKEMNFIKQKKKFIEKYCTREDYVNGIFSQAAKGKTHIRILQ